MGERLRGLLKIHSGEESVVGRLLALMLVLWSAATIGASGVESLLFSRYGPKALPYLFIILGFMTVPVTAGLGILLRRSNRRRVLSLFPLFLGAVLLVGWALLFLDAEWIYPAQWLLMMVVWIMEATAAWAVAALVNNTRQAKRLFPLYGAGQIVGGVAGGLLTVPLAKLLHAENLVLIWIAVLAVSAVLIKTILKAAPRDGIVRRADSKPIGLVRSAEEGLKLVRASSLLRWLAASMILFALLYNALSFIFAGAVTARFPRTDSLAAFLGFFNAVINGAALIVSLFVANRLFTRFGVPAMVMTLGAIYLIGFTGLAVGVGFAVLVGFRLSQMVWVNGIWITGWQALFTIVPPDRRGQVTSFMDGVAWEAGMMLAGIALLTAEAFGGARPVALVGVVSAALLILSMWKARRAYGPAVAEAVRAGRPDVFTTEDEPFGGFRTDAAAVAALVESAADPDVDVRRIAVTIAADLGGPEAVRALLVAAVDEDPGVRATALRGLARYPDPAAYQPAEQGLSHSDETVRTASIDALVASSPRPENAAATLLPLLYDPHGDVRARAAVGIHRLRPVAECLSELVAMVGSSEPAERAAAVLALGELDNEVELILACLKDPDPEVRQSAIRALADNHSDEARQSLIEALGDPSPAVRDAAADVMGMWGGDGVDLLEAALIDARLEAHALRVLRHTGGAHFDHVSGYSRDQVEWATHYGNLALRLGADGNDRIELLAHSLNARMLHHATNALWATAAAGDIHRLEPAIESVTSSDSAQRATALEAIDALGRPEIVGPLLRLWEREPARRPDVTSVIAEVLNDDDPWLRATAAFAIGSLSENTLGERLEAIATADTDAGVRTAALAVLKGVEMETLDTLPLMRRVLFLRKVALFSDLAPADLKSIAEAAVENIYSDGELIAEQGEPGGEMHVVVSGEIEVDVTGPDARSALARRGPGEVVGEMSLISGKPRMASLVAGGDVRTLSIDQYRFRRILVDRPEVSLAVMRQLCARIEDPGEHYGVRR